MNFGLISTVSFLSVRADGTYAPFSADAWKYAGEMTLLGMLMVFAVLAMLWLVLTLFKVIFVPKAKKEKATSAVKAPEVTAEENAVVAQDNNDANGELLAVITAAVAAYMAEENGGEAPAEGFRVVSFKRTGSRAWNAK